MKIKVLTAAAVSMFLTLACLGRARAQEPSSARSKQMAVNVLGEVNQPGRYLLPEGATALDALAAAGGQKPEASLKAVKLIHASTGDQPLTDVFDMKAVLAGTKVAPVLHAGDSLSFSRTLIGITF